MKTLSEYLELLNDRPKKWSESEVNYLPAPEGSAMRCTACLHYFRRAIDGFSTCEIMRSERTDREGVFPDWRCSFWTVTGDVFPLLDKESEEESDTRDDEHGADEDDDNPQE